MTRKPFHEIRENQELALLVLVWFNQVGSKNMSLEFFVDTFRAKFSDFNSRRGGPAPSNRAIRKLVNRVARQYPNIQLTMRKTDDTPQVWYINQPNQVSELPRYPFNSKVAFAEWKNDTFIDLTILPFPEFPKFNPDFLSKRGKKFVETLENLFLTQFFIINWCRRQPEVIS